MVRGPSGQITVRMIAAEAGVSPATVSRVLSGTTHVSRATADQVHDAVARIGRGVPARRSPDQSRSSRGTIFVRCPDVLTDYFGLIVSAVTESLQLEGWRVELDAGVSSWVRNPLQSLAATPGVAGAILVLPPEPSDDFALVLARRFPFVVIDPRSPLPPGVPSVSAGHLTASRRLTQHLTELGHRRIGAIVGPADWQASIDRLAGVESALASVGVIHDQALVRRLTPTFQHGFEAAGELLDHPEPPTALVCFNDKVAVGALRAAAIRGLRVPEDLSITGFDDLDVSHVTEPPLTTVRQPLEGMGRMAVSLLLHLLEGDPVESNHVEVATSLVVRGSTGPPPAEPGVEEAVQDATNSI